MDVMMDPMVERSKGGAYESYVQNFVRNSNHASSLLSPPSVISNVVIKAAESKNPQRRYAAGFGAKPLMFIRKWFGDAVMDFICLSQIKK